MIGLGLQAQKKFEVNAYYNGNGNNIENYELVKITQIIYSFTHLKGDTIHSPSEKKKEGLKKPGGIMFWELTCLKPQNGLLATLDKAVKKLQENN